MSLGFQITRRHYDIIIDQAYKNYPQECGGFVGGKDMVISAILPTFNMHLYDKTDTYALTSEDIERAHAFFEKHKLEYYGVYHTHPKGYAIPSKQDLINVQKYLFIISLRDYKNPDFAAYEVTGAQMADRISLSILEGGYDIKDIHDASTKEANPAAPEDITQDVHSEMNKLNTLMNDITNEAPNYKKRGPKEDDGSSDFSTVA